MELTVRKKGNSAMVAVNGKVTATNLNESLRGVVKRLFAEGITDVVLDLKEVQHIDSTGVGELVSAYTTATKEDGGLHLFNTPDTVLELLEITNLKDVFSFVTGGDPVVSKFH